ncbi:MAG: hypothetical protein E5V72_01380 [Mesorhizobium sp.]|uniref:hypothetical protein n=1 Tax=Mesorhizobium sp. TaxID=1871066 RepID=UPI000FE999F0|nr:hypothetical protein [Mesorhizobium sp.]RWI47556.1 MAG: hypothetical protein EOR15_13835 [Mesorhizobium sp.]RWI69717.1 MAG: hypothetical protein EOR18_21040 [Mesorhizobium sp.]RWI76184.1 MAG: hypothetical protein EOR19_18630 [Mesorhizobium sp.]RWI88190.1 MAG: hypothetical protein EOR20_03890 [Mesorhizobium sp.]RWJ33254.1 MAG: hypothetical protein EOR28_11760 [Mesorhizobium sp.]
MKWITATVVGVYLVVFVQMLTEPAYGRYYVLEAVTPDGQVFVAGSGSDCESAWANPVFPAAVVRVSCIRLR